MILTSQNKAKTFDISPILRCINANLHGSSVNLCIYINEKCIYNKSKIHIKIE